MTADWRPTIGPGRGPTIIQFDPTELLVYIWNSTQNQTMDIPFALIVAC